MKKLKALLGAVIIPLGAAGEWQVLGFKNIKPNAVRFDGGMKIEVDGSAGPIVHKLSRPVKLRGLRAKGSYGPALKFEAGRQGEKGFDDFPVRVGIVIKGDKRLNWLQAKMAPAWVKHLYALAPKGTGIDRIELVNLVNDPALVGRERKHPKSELLIEKFNAVAAADGAFTLNQTWSPAPEVLAIWISADGDDTKARFKVDLTTLELETTD